MSADRDWLAYLDLCAYIIGVTHQARICRQFQHEPTPDLAERIHRLERTLRSYEDRTDHRVEVQWVMA